MTVAFPSQALSVRPAAAVAHAAAQFPAGPSARLRFRDHFDPCCFVLEGYEDPQASPRRTYVFIAWPDGDGSRLELTGTGHAPAVNLILVLTCLVLLVLGFALDQVRLLVLGSLVTLAQAIISEHDRRPPPEELDREIVEAVSRAFEPLRRPGLPYREPAPEP